MREITSDDVIEVDSSVLGPCEADIYHTGWLWHMTPLSCIIRGEDQIFPTRRIKFKESCPPLLQLWQFITHKCPQPNAPSTHCCGPRGLTSLGCLIGTLLVGTYNWVKCTCVRTVHMRKTSWNWPSLHSREEKTYCKASSALILTSLGQCTSWPQQLYLGNWGRMRTQSSLLWEEPTSDVFHPSNMLSVLYPLVWSSSHQAKAGNTLWSGHQGANSS